MVGLSNQQWNFRIDSRQYGTTTTIEFFLTREDIIRSFGQLVSKKQYLKLIRKATLSFFSILLVLQMANTLAFGSDG